jgi:hypothetical protein
MRTLVFSKEPVVALKILKLLGCQNIPSSGNNMPYGFVPERGPRTRIRAETRTAEPRGPKFKIRGHSAPRSAARMPADVCRTLIKQTISDDTAVYFWLLNMSQNEMQKNSLKDRAQTKTKIFLLWKHLRSSSILGFFFVYEGFFFLKGFTTVFDQKKFFFTFFIVKNRSYWYPALL